MWRLLKFQPFHKGVACARGHLITTNKSRAKQIAVALPVDWRRIRTRRSTAEELRLK